MKRCPECRRDYYDDTLSFCLEDGAALVNGVPDDPPTAILHNTESHSDAKRRAVGDSYGPAVSAPLEGPASGSQYGDEPQTAILQEIASPAEAATRAQIHTTEAGPRGHVSMRPERQGISGHPAAKPLIAGGDLARMTRHLNGWRKTSAIVPEPWPRSDTPMRLNRSKATRDLWTCLKGMGLPQ